MIILSLGESTNSTSRAHRKQKENQSDSDAISVDRNSQIASHCSKAQKQKQKVSGLTPSFLVYLFFPSFYQITALLDQNFAKTLVAGIQQPWPHDGTEQATAVAQDAPNLREDAASALDRGGLHLLTWEEGNVQRITDYIYW